MSEREDSKITDEQLAGLVVGAEIMARKEIGDNRTWCRLIFSALTELQSRRSTPDEGREAVIEECARVAEDFDCTSYHYAPEVADGIAATIRSLSPSPSN